MIRAREPTKRRQGRGTRGNFRMLWAQGPASHIATSFSRRSGTVTVRSGFVQWCSFPLLAPNRSHIRFRELKMIYKKVLLASLTACSLSFSASVLSDASAADELMAALKACKARVQQGMVANSSTHTAVISACEKGKHCDHSQRMFQGLGIRQAASSTPECL